MPGLGTIKEHESKFCFTYLQEQRVPLLGLLGKGVLLGAALHSCVVCTNGVLGIHQLYAQIWASTGFMKFSTLNAPRVRCM